MVGTFVLAGGAEFQDIYDEADRSLLAMMPANARQIVIVPAADTDEDLVTAIASGVHHFHALAPHATVEGALIVDAASANDRALAGRIASANLVYLSGADPLALVSALRGSELLAAIAAVAARGGIVAGSDGGAIALCEAMRYGHGWRSGLGLVPGVVVLPYHDDTPAPLATMRAGLPDTTVVLGIPAGVNCVAYNEPGADEAVSWYVLGKRPITLYRPTGIMQAHAGETFTIDAA